MGDDYRSIFPPDVHAVFDHGKRAVSRFPIATGEYYKQDYSSGVDISKYKNIPVPTSYMAIESKFDFIGGYSDDARGGLLHVADHHVSPGKKQWTWGNGDFGVAWDRNLTDEDGPYIELMTGVFTDNQPDFSWLGPGEERSWVQYFMPYAEVGSVQNANKDAIVNVDTGGGFTRITLYTTSEFEDLRIILRDSNGKVYLDDRADTSPRTSYHKQLSTGETLAEDVIFELLTSDGRELLTYRADKPEIKSTPDPASAAKLPKDISSIEQLYLTGLHLEQYRHATFNPEDYYSEALEREPGDIRCNNAMGLLLMRKGQFGEAESLFRTAVKTQTERNPNPYDGEPRYNLGQCLVMQGRYDEAYDAFFKATWNAAMQDAAYLALARIDARKGLWERALEHVDRSLIRNWHNHKARQLKVSILRKLGRNSEALVLAKESLMIDAFNAGCRFEKYLLTGSDADLRELKTLMRGAVHSYIEYTLDFADAGLRNEAEQFLSLCIDDENRVYPMVYYLLGWLASDSGDEQKARQLYEKAAGMSPDKCFPNRIEEVVILEDAIRLCPDDHHAPYYLGNFMYAAGRYDEARRCWERSLELYGGFPIVFRNLALAYYNKCGMKSQAKELLEQAFALDPENSRLLMELDQLYKKLMVEPADRLALLEKYSELVERRDDLEIERITLYNLSGRYDEALRLIGRRKFHPWEGGEGKVTRQYTISLLGLAKEAIAQGRWEDALKFLHMTDSYPQNLGEGKLANAEENDIEYYKGIAYRGAGDDERAMLHLRMAAAGSSEPNQALFYNDQQPDKIYYRGLAWAALGENGKARSCYNKLIDHGEKHLFDTCRMDYFAVSLPDLAIWEEDLNVRNRIHCYYMMGLGHLGLGNRDKASEYLEIVKSMDVSHIDSRLILSDLYGTSLKIS